MPARSAVLLALGLLGCDARPTFGGPDSFVLCEPAPSLQRSARRIEFDYATGMVVFVDVGAPAEKCSDAAGDCMAAPLPLGRPPRLPADGETVEWREGKAAFRISQLTRRGDFAVAAIGNDRTLAWVYSRDLGVISLEIIWPDGTTEIFHRCRGAMKFEDIRRLTRHAG